MYVESYTAQRTDEQFSTYRMCNEKLFSLLFGYFCWFVDESIVDDGMSVRADKMFAIKETHARCTEEWNK